MCMQMRGVEKLNSKTQTIALRGDFKTNQKLKEQFFNLMK